MQTMQYDYDVAIIGAGPGGYVAAIRAAQLGLKACVIERDKPGGVCLNIGCIPSKSLIHQAGLVSQAGELAALGASVDLSTLDYRRAFKASRLAAERLSKGVSFLLRKNGVEYITGNAHLTGAHSIELDSGRSLSATAIILATGSRPRGLPGFDFDESAVLSSTGALMLEKLPKRAVILGAGAIGMELGHVWRAFGVEVTIIEMLDRILPLEDADAAQVVRKAFEKRGVRFMTGTRATAMERLPDGSLRISLAAAGAGAPPSSVPPSSVPPSSVPPASVPDSASDATTSGQSITVDAVLVAVGRHPNTEQLGLEQLGIRLDRGFVPVGDFGQTAAAGIYAIGDIVTWHTGNSTGQDKSGGARLNAVPGNSGGMVATAHPQLAHVASKEGEIAVEHIARLLGGRSGPTESRPDPSTIPSAVYCEPELASFGLSAERAAALGRRHAVFTFPYRGIGKAVAVERPDGFVRIVHDPSTAEILGASIVGERATDIIHELILARHAELTLDELAGMVHAHPTIAEGVMEAARGGLGRAVHA
jgi:dihydrolipoamide dehydrogenase